MLPSPCPAEGNKNFYRPARFRYIELCRTGQGETAMRKVVSRILISVLMVSAMGVYAQTMKSDHWSTAELLERAKQLKELARRATAQPARRSRNIRTITRCSLIGSTAAAAKLHQNFADIFFILEGHATVVTGGSLVEAKKPPPRRDCAASPSKAAHGRNSRPATSSTSPQACRIKHWYATANRLPILW